MVSSSPLPTALSIVFFERNVATVCILSVGMEEVMCGNPVRALKARRRRSLSSQVPYPSIMTVHDTHTVSVTPRVQ